MNKARVKVPFDLEAGLLYRSAKTCCACRTPRAPVQVHHIDQNPSNNSEDNLVVLCQNCHDDAHTKRALSKNLTPSLLKKFKGEWEEEVAERASYAMTPRANLSQAMWTFVNHQRLPYVMKDFGVTFNSEVLRFLRRRKVVDDLGTPIFQKKVGDSGGLVTIYDRFEWDDGQRLHSLYVNAVDNLVMAAHPIELGAIWSKREIRALIGPGSICFCMRGFRFKSGDRKNGEEDREVYARAQGIEVRFMANTRHMYGSSALYDSFSGNRFAAVLFFVKDIASENGVLVIRGTPLAMGAGFVSFAYRTPMSLRYGWASRGGQVEEDTEVVDLLRS